VIYGVLALLAEFEEVSELVLRLSLRVEVHVQLLLKVLPGLRVLSLFTVLLSVVLIVIEALI
jgi:hypothetical protein